MLIVVSSKEAVALITAVMSSAQIVLSETAIKRRESASSAFPRSRYVSGVTAEGDDREERTFLRIGAIAA